MTDFIEFLTQPTSIIAIILPCLLSFSFIVYELMNWTTSKTYLFIFALTLAFGSFATFWDISVSISQLEDSDIYHTHAGLHIIPIFTFILTLSTHYYKKWTISKPMIIALGYLQVLFVDCFVSFHSNMAHLIMQKTQVSSFVANQLAKTLGLWYEGIGGGGITDTLSLMFYLPLLAIVGNDLLTKVFKKNKKIIFS